MDKKEKKSLLEMPIWKSLLLLSIPIVLTNMLQVAYQFTDSFWVWRLWQDAVATTTIAWTIIFLTISIWSWFAVAGSVLISQFFWAKNYKMVSKVASQSLLMIFITSVILWLIGFLLSPTLVTLMWADSEILAQTVLFVRLSFIWIIFNFSFFMFQSIMRWIWEANLPIYIVLWTVLLNFVLDPLFIFWYSSFEGFWVVWAAIATIFTQSIAAIIWLVILFSWKFNIKTRFEDYKPDFSLIKKSFKLWLPSSIEMTARSWSFAVLTWIVWMFWTLYLAWFWVASNILQFVVIFAMWISMATSILIWQNMWAWLVENAKKINKIGIIVSFLLLSWMWVISFVFAPYFIAFFVPEDEAVIKIWAEIVRITSIFFGLIWIQMAINWTLRAIWETKIPMYTTILWQWIIKIPLAFILASIWSIWVVWIWWAEPISSIILCIILFFLLRKIDFSKWNLTKEEKDQKQVIEESIIEEPLRDF